MTTTTFVEYNGDGSDLTFDYSFPTYKQSEVKVAVSGVLVDNWTITGGWTASGTKEVKFDNTTGTTNAAVCNSSTGAPLAGTNNVRIFRDTDIDSAKYTFNAGSSIKADELNTNHEQLRRALQEEQYNTVHTYDIRDGAINTDKILDGTIVDADVSPTAEIQVSKLKDGSARQVLQTAANGSDVEWTSNVDIPGTLDVQGNTKLEGNLDVTGSLDVNSLAHIAGATGIDGNFDINTTKFTVNATSGNTTVAGTLDVTGLSTLASVDINGGAIDNTTIGASSAVAGTFSTGTIATADINGGAIDGTTIGANSAAAGTFTTVNASGTITGNVTGDITGNADTATDLAAATKITASEQAAHTVNDTTYFTTSATEARYFNTSTGETIKDGDAFPDNDTTIATTAAINDRIIDLVDDVGGFVPIANELAFPNANPDVNNGTGTLVSVKTLSTSYTSSGSGVITIANGTVGNSTVTINGAENSTTYGPNFGMILETTTTLNTYTFHRLVPKATEVTTLAGKATEMGLLGTAAVVEDMGILGTAAIVEDMSLLGTTACVADMALLGDSAVIADMATIADTSGLISNIGTVAGAATNVNNVGGSIANVNTVAGNLSSVNDFGARYRAATNNAGEYSSDNDVGDLYFNTSINAIKVWNGSAWVAGVTDTGDYAVTTGNTFTGNNDHNDNVKVRLGSDDDLEIYHSGSDATIDNNTGDLTISTTGSGDDILITSADDIILKAAGSENAIICTGDGAVELYHDNVKVFNTEANGIFVAGPEGGNSIVYMYADEGDDLADKWSLQATTSAEFTINYINDSSSWEKSIECNRDGNVELYYDNSKKLETTANGVTITGNQNFADDGYAYFGAGNDMGLYSDGSGGFIKSDDLTIGTFTGAEKYIDATLNGAVDLYYNNVKKLETTNTGTTTTGNATITGHIYQGDSDVHYFGDGPDLAIWHTGSHGFIRNTEGNLYIYSADGHDGHVVIQATYGEESIICEDNGAVKLYYDNSTKFETTSSGVKMPDSAQFELGTGSDLKMWHSGSDSFIRNETGNLTIEANGSGDDAIKIIPDGAVDLYYDNVKTCETTANGLKVQGPEGGDGIIQIYADEGDDNADRWRLHSEADSSTFSIQNYNNGSSWETNIKCTGDGDVKLYYDNTQKLATSSTGIWVSGYLSGEGLDIADSKKLLLGSGDDLEIYFDAANSIIDHTSGSGSLLLMGDSLKLQTSQATPEDYITCSEGGAVKLYFNDSEKLATSSIGVTVTGDVTASGVIIGTNFQPTGYLKLTDDNIVYIGTGNDLQLYHDSSGGNSYIKNNTGRLYIDADATEFVGYTHNYLGDSTGTPHAQSILILEDEDNVVIQTLTQNDHAVEMRFGDQDDNGAGWMQYAHATNTWSVGTNGSQRMYINESGSLYVQGVYDSTTGSGANVEVSSGGKIRRSTSSRRYKTSIETLEDKYADAILEARPVWYKSLCEDDNKDHGHWGFIAEEIEKIDPRLCTYKTVEIETNRDVVTEKKLDTPIVESVQYDRFVPHLINLIKRQDTKIKALETKVAALEAG